MLVAAGANIVAETDSESENKRESESKSERVSESEGKREEERERERKREREKKQYMVLAFWPSSLSHKKKESSTLPSSMTPDVSKGRVP